jgi:HSP20 family protein
MFPQFDDENRKLDNRYEIQSGRCQPAVNIYESIENFCIEVAAPGLEKSDFRVDIENNNLIISSEKTQEKQTQGKILRKEFCYEKFSRRFETPPNIIQTDNITATYNDGILKVILPKRKIAENNQKKEITIS